MSKFTLEVCADSVESVLAAEKGDTIKFAFDMEKSHFFDKETELVICN